jgi:hypothetical protein
MPPTEGFPGSEVCSKVGELDAECRCVQRAEIGVELELEGLKTVVRGTNSWRGEN